MLTSSCPVGAENDSGSAKKEKKNRKKDKENGSSGGEAGNHNDIDAPDAVVSAALRSSPVKPLTSVRDEKHWC